MIAKLDIQYWHQGPGLTVAKVCRSCLNLRFSRDNEKRACAELSEIKAQPKVMTEYRDEYQRKFADLDAQRLAHIKAHHPEGWDPGAARIKEKVCADGFSAHLRHIESDVGLGYNRMRVEATWVFGEDTDETDATAADVWALMEHMGNATPNELTLLRMRADKLMTEDRKEYGKLDLATDKRSLEDFVREAFDEKEDSAAYLDMAMLKIEADKK